tara:strand:+ start:4086 stop:4601 length:516 start_codon:yes stop_codon:yes gene_type:complete
MKIGNKAAASRNARSKRPAQVSLENLDRVINDIYSDINELTTNVTQLNDQRDLGKGRIGMTRAVKDGQGKYTLEAYTTDGWASVPLDISRDSSSDSRRKWDLSQGTPAATFYSKFKAKLIDRDQHTGSEVYVVDDATAVEDIDKTLMITVNNLSASLSSLIKQLIKKRIIK